MCPVYPGFTAKYFFNCFFLVIHVLVSFRLVDCSTLFQNFESTGAVFAVARPRQDAENQFPAGGADVFWFIPCPLTPFSTSRAKTAVRRFQRLLCVDRFVQIADIDLLDLSGADSGDSPAENLQRQFDFFGPVGDAVVGVYAYAVQPAALDVRISMTLGPAANRINAREIEHCWWSDSMQAPRSLNL